jgi:hypothetical protein
MARDAIKNLLKVKVVGDYSNSDTTIEIDSDDFSRLPDPATEGQYNLVWWDIESYPDPSDDPNVEIVRVQSSNSGTNKITVDRGQEDTTATAKSGELMLMLALTKKTLTDIFGEIDENKLTAVVVEIEASDWEDNEAIKTVTGVTSESIVWVSPTPASYEDYVEAEIRATAQGTNQITFKCEETPISTVVVIVAFAN